MKSRSKKYFFSIKQKKLMNKLKMLYAINKEKPSGAFVVLPIDYSFLNLGK